MRADVIVFPVIGCNDQGVVDSPFANDEVVLTKDMFAEIREETVSLYRHGQKFIETHGRRIQFQVNRAA